MKRLLLFLLLISVCAFGKELKTIETESVRVVFEEGLEKQAEETANYIESLKKYYGDMFEGDLKTIPVILRKGNNMSNAFFTAMPNKLDYITIAPVSNNLGVTPWLLDLSIHEYRHFMQYQLVRENNLNKLGYALGGNTLVFYMGFLTLPNWVWEGEATSFETKLSYNGRGRTPNFLKNYRALLSEGKEFSYEKAKNTSYKDMVPSAYHLGYLLISYGYEKYGEKFWDDIFINGSEPTGFTPFSKVLKEKTGMSSKEFYREALSYFKEKFKEEKSVNYENILERDKTPANYTYAYDYDNSLITLKASYDKRAGFYKLKGKAQEKILDAGIMTDDYFEVKNRKIIWTEIEPDLTKTKVNYSLIKIYDLDKKKKISLTDKTYYYSPSLSNKGDKIAAIKNNGYEPLAIDILDGKGNLIKELTNKNQYFYNYIKWIDDDTLVVVLRDKNGKMGMKTIDINSEKEKELLAFDNYILSVPFVYGRDVYFSGSFEMVENVYKINMDNKELRKITDSNIGTYSATVVNNRLYFSEYSSEGYKLKSTDNLQGDSAKETSLLEDSKINLDYLKNSEFKLADNIGAKEYEVKDYDYLKHMVNIHSWNYSYSDKVLALNLLSTNELEDLNLSLNYTKDENKNKKTYELSGEFTKYWPKLSFDYENIDENNDKDNKFGVGIDFPFDFSKDAFSRKLDLSLKCYNYTEDNLKYAQTGVNFVNYKYKGFRDIVSENSQAIRINYTQNLDDSENNKLETDARFTTQAFKENDGFSYKLSADKNRGELKMIDNEIKSRGYELIDYKLAVKNSFDYYFPIAYPDRGGKGFFLKRVTGDLFYDNTLIENENKGNYNSIGTKLNFDITLLSMAPLTFGVQYSYLLKNSESNLALEVQLNM